MQKVYLGVVVSTWLIKEFSAMTNLSVRSLHHYDQIGLLKPSKRLTNGYRSYSQLELLKVQPIIVLRFLGFSLLAIRDILKNGSISLHHLQERCLVSHEELENITAVCKGLDLIKKSCGSEESVKLSKTLGLIEEHLFEPLRKVLKKHRIVGQSPEELVLIRKRWESLIKEIEGCLDEDPRSSIGKSMAQAWNELLIEGQSKDLQMKEAIGCAYNRGKIPNTHCSKRFSDWLKIALHPNQVLTLK